MTAIIGFSGAILGVLLGAIATYLTARSSMRLTLEHAYDQALQGERLERYQELFHISRCLPRYWPPAHEEPTRKDLRQYIERFHDWYFGEGAGGMFLTSAAKNIYMRLLNLLAELAFTDGDEPDGPAVRPLSAAESQALRQLAGDLRRQLAEDTGAANPPRLRWTRPGPQVPPPGMRAGGRGGGDADGGHGGRAETGNDDARVSHG